MVNISISTPQDIKLRIADICKSKRKKEKVSREELAQFVGMSKTTLQNIELGKNYTFDNLLKVAYYFGLLDQIMETLTAYQEQDDLNNMSLY
ncbi:MAG: helix-turn-helix domain-containing protein [Flavobacteriales bacterium]|jgi:transcriptional regulator with XRE-family HTH domain|nr:helix-turn-helix domain-containing protein [Flavobacteriales bacterium]